ncbi:MAG: DUF5009 domain-containing protein [candidate division KSB1 bacterium]|nr:DUF5009 domain-containing protein [candidate division KSB1 bacterium]
MSTPVAFGPDTKHTSVPPMLDGGRILPLDALRGLAILLMVLSGVIPYGVLPAWMYHAQLPPPSHTFDPTRAGLTWVDLVFPLFLFSMGAAIPLALTRRLAKRPPLLKVLLGIAERGFLLAFFAIFLRHVRPHVLNPRPTAGTWGIALAGFGVMFLLFTRLPARWSWWQKRLVRGLGWSAAVALLATLRYPDGSGFSLQRSDIILLVLANVAVSGSLIWLLTRNHLLLRLGVLGVLLALRLASAEPGWVKWLWQATPAPWLYKLYYHQYLFVVIPGTIAGDLCVRWAEGLQKGSAREGTWGIPRSAGLVGTALGLVVVALVGLQARWLWQTTLLSLALSGGALHLSRRASSEHEVLVKRLLLWGTYWLVLGLVFEPYEGGIKKDHSTLSYYFLTTGLASFLLTVFIVIIHMWRGRRLVQLLVENGQNPMLAYVGVANAIWPVFGLTRVDGLLTAITTSPWLGFLRGVGYTLLLALMVGWLTRRRVFWRT